MRTIIIPNCDSFADAAPNACKLDIDFGSRGALAGIRRALESHGWQVRVDAKRIVDCSQADWVLLDDVPKPSRPKYLAHYLKHYGEKVGLLAFEPPTYLPANWDAALHARFRFVIGWDPHFPGANFWPARLPYDIGMTPQQPVPFSERKLCVLFACNKRSEHPQELYSARRHVVRFFERQHPEDFDLFGKGWQSDAFADPRYMESRQLEWMGLKLGWVEPYRSWRGAVRDKFAAMSRYRFSICYENGAFPGYFTEKMLDCFNAMCVPIYLGAPDVTSIVPPEAFIDRRQFTDDEDMYRYLLSVDARRFESYLEAIRGFLGSNAYQAFSGEQFAETIVRALTHAEQQEGMGRTGRMRDGVGDTSWV